MLTQVIFKKATGTLAGKDEGKAGKVFVFVF